jgi:NAD(P)-dependent dehydrogenase (short-subunit alcohol dehydrogenase family)
VNNAGVLRYSTFTSAPDLDAARQEMETNYFGTLRMCRAFAPVLAAAGGGAIVTLVVAVHAGFIGTEMAALTDAPKISPESVAKQAFDAVEAAQIEVLVDERSRDVKASLSRDQELIYPPIQEFWDAAVSGTS